MDKTPVVIVGAGGFGRETADVVTALRRPLHGIIDDAPSAVNFRRLEDRSIRHLGTLERWISEGDRAYPFLLGIGSPRVKAHIVDRLERAGFTTTTVVHPSAVIGTRSSIAPGAIVCAGVNVSTNCSIGRHVHLNPGVTIGHDTEVDDFSSVNPSTTIGGEVRVGRRVLLGSASNVLQGLSIGDETVVGASALVTKNVPDGVVVKGIPGRW